MLLTTENLSIHLFLGDYHLDPREHIRLQHRRLSFWYFPFLNAMPIHMKPRV